MPEPAPGTQTANARFDALWDDIGAKRIIIGDADKGVEISIDADLSIFSILDKLKAAAESGHAQGDISDDEEKIVKHTVEQTARNLSGGIHDKLRRQVSRLKNRN